MIPLIGCMCKGPLGIRQLPRTWWKGLTKALDLLDPSYPENSGGLDHWCLETLRVDDTLAYDYIHEALPTYVEFETWILDTIGRDPEPARVARFNRAAERRVHNRLHKIEETYADIGYDLDVHTEVGAVLLNTLQDWQLFHRIDLGSTETNDAHPMPPLISSIDVGPLGVMQLPRTWLKITLHARGLLHADYPACGGGLDQNVLDALQLDRAETIDYITSESPDYLKFESWVCRQTRDDIDRDAVATFHTFFQNRTHPEEKRAGIYEVAGLPADYPITNGVLLNHLEDWAYAHRAVTAHVR